MEEEVDVHEEPDEPGDPVEELRTPSPKQLSRLSQLARSVAPSLKDVTSSH